MRRTLLVLAVAAGVLLGAASPRSADAAGPDAVTPWVELELDAIASRRTNPPLYGGIHFASDNNAGLKLGRRVGAVAVDRYRVKG